MIDVYKYKVVVRVENEKVLYNNREKNVKKKRI
jgi:hypothetical protein